MKQLCCPDGAHGPGPKRCWEKQNMPDPFFFEPWILDGSLDLEIFDTHLSIHAIGCDGTVFHTNSACRRKIADTVCKRIPFFALLL